MVVVYLKNGEKAPLPDATHVRLETVSEPLLRCYFNEQEVGQFKWSEVAGYSMAARSDISSSSAYEAWHQRYNLGNS